VKVVTSVAEMKELVQEWKSGGLTIGFVPTMGALHEGHLSLVRESRRRCAVTAVSVFVNPSQFGPEEDFKAYPRGFEKDRTLLAREGVDCVFHPEAGEVYPPGYRTFVEVQGLQDRLCGGSRPGHFRGVATVVLKLFHIVRPDVAFFGWKDAQQLILLRKMAADLDLGLELAGCPIVREQDGLAMSSRNLYLSTEERTAALVLSRSLGEAGAEIAAGERRGAEVARIVREMIAGEPLARLEYVEIVDMEELRPLKNLAGEVLVAAAVRIGTTRLIDNVRITVKEPGRFRG
jgi:pantoate--beta-alanine ligase